ncbi:hypothetical protein OPV22_000940 [Ensete ventricosum]|uniref:Glycine cleavage system H protein n=1 Tax=Ensete ventricosum TaxID=4639 RepID=A0AAV8RRB5_ENSVE|nr:hypothetical protein OPV22_000940 [Ensete ventricosum]
MTIVGIKGSERVRDKEREGERGVRGFEHGVQGAVGFETRLLPEDLYLLQWLLHCAGCEKDEQKGLRQLAYGGSAIVTVVFNVGVRRSRSIKLDVKQLILHNFIVLGHGMLNLRYLDFEVSSVSFVIKDLKYADTHEWVKVHGSSATIGITDHAQDHLGDVVYVELPEVGTTVAQGKSFGAIESVKATSDVNSPVSGEVVEVNSELTGFPGFVNASSLREWLDCKALVAHAGASFMGSKAFLDPTR